ncbi:hypothetical protein JCM8097_005591 [Rhodosporidiobolus ruineniae]
MASSTSSSASTAASTERGTDEDREEGAEAVKASPFDRLPDEIVLQVLDHLFHDGDGAELIDLLVCNRLWSLAESVYHSVWAPKPAEVLQRYFEPEVRRSVRALDYSPSGDGVPSFAFETLALTAFSNITVLAFEGTPTAGNNSLVYLPTSFSRALTSFQHLVYLSLDFDVDFAFSDPSFSVGANLPWLRELFLGHTCQSQLQLLLHPQSHLRHLAVNLNAAARSEALLGGLPWSDLTSLSLALRDENDEEPEEGVVALGQLVSSLQTALYPSNSTSPVPLPLRRFELFDVIFQHSATASAGSTARRAFDLALVPFFDLLKFTSLERLELYLESPSEIPNGLGRVPCVTSLGLVCSDVDFSRTGEVEGIFKLLDRFPSVTRLDLHHGIFSPAVSSSDRLALAPDSPLFLIRHPPLSALLSALARSPVMDFSWVDYSGSAERYRWTRSSVAERFVGERWRG